MGFRSVLLAAALLPAVALAQNNGGEQAASPAPTSYAELIRQDQPVGWWRFGEADGQPIRSSAAGTSLPDGSLVGKVTLAPIGPTATGYRLFEKENQALQLVGAKGYVRIADPGAQSPFDFTNGDAITMEAWVNPDSLSNGQQTYVIGKGRTNQPGTAPENQSWALRLRGVNGSARVSFLFRDDRNRKGEDKDYHRWTSSDGFVPDGAWHHVAVVYEFGTARSIRAYVDGRETEGTWDMGAATTQPPVVDDDDVWIGSSMGGNPGCTFRGGIDEVALYRTALPAERLRQRYQAIPVDTRAAELAASVDVPSDRILVELHEGLTSDPTWAFRLSPAVEAYSEPLFAFSRLPRKYTATGVIADRANPTLVRARTKIRLEGELDLLLRAKNAARLFVDGKLVAQTDFLNRNASGHEHVPEVAVDSRDDLRPLPPGCQEKLAHLTLEPGEHVFRLEAMAGGQGLRHELDELCVAILPTKGRWQVLGPREKAAATDEAWLQLVDRQRQRLFDQDARQRQAASQEWKTYWDRRHDYAREVVSKKAPLLVPEARAGWPVNNDVDRFLSQAPAATPAPGIDDLTFLRRLTLDLVGVVPSFEEVVWFLHLSESERRSQAIQKFLKDPRAADHGVAYWQDVLAENPGILKPELNNTGPFRWWIHESLLDNKPLDRFATELVLMEGSVWYGGPAGFGLATQNDAPMASKAHVLAKAFLAMDLTCARCHDAPYHPFKQQELFNLAAMLQRKDLVLPKTSTVPPNPGGRIPAITISLKPGETIPPAWPFSRLSAALPAMTGSAVAGTPESLPQDFLRKANDSREQLAFLLTSPNNDRFAKVYVNRLWQRLMGKALTEPVDDWDGAGATASAPELLEFLARKFIESGYDSQALAQTLVESRAYQSERVGNGVLVRKRLSAEQVADSLMTVSGKAYDSEPLTMDPEGRRPVDSFLHLGSPTRAWQFTSLSNERDRPALALPVAQSVVDLLLAFGWREARQFPLTNREDAVTPLQPLTLANGIVGNRAVRLSDDSAFTALAFNDQPIESLVDGIFLRVLTRAPTDDERAAFVELLSEGYSTRKVEGAAPAKRPQSRNAVSWSNHLSAEATKIKQDLERAVLAGDPPTPRLQADWRERMEDAVWSLVNSPEFAFAP